MGEHSTRRGLRISGAGRVGAVVGVSLLAAALLTGTALAADHDDTIDGTPCTASARACVDLSDNQAWLIDDGNVVRGPVGMSHGGEGKETPQGTFSVQWKDKDHRSAEFNDAPMPYSVFFAPGGIAFHQGNPNNASAGCVHLTQSDAAAFYDFLQVGDEVQVH